MPFKYPSYKFRNVVVPYHPYVLPTVKYHGKEYTVDTRQEEFRNVKYGEEPSYVPFDSQLGQTLLKRYHQQQLQRKRTRYV